MPQNSFGIAADGIAAQRLVKDAVGLAVAIRLQAVGVGVVVELATQGEIAEARHRVGGEGHGDVATSVELLDERIA